MSKNLCLKRLFKRFSKQAEAVE